MNSTVITSIRSSEPAALSQGDDAYLRLRSEVISCRLPPGAIVTEPELMAAYDISKTSCRIALTRLSQDGLVRSRPRRGYQVSPITLRDVKEVFQLRAQIEPLGARLAVGRVDLERLRDLEAACRQPHPVLSLHEQIDVFMDANKAFHLAIAQASGNERLHRMLAGLLDEMSRLVALGFGVQGTKPEIKDDHNALIDAFAADDAQGAERITRSHIETFRAMTLEKLYASLAETGAAIPVQGPGSWR